MYRVPLRIGESATIPTLFFSLAHASSPPFCGPPIPASGLLWRLRCCTHELGDCVLVRPRSRLSVRMSPRSSTGRGHRTISSPSSSHARVCSLLRCGKRRTFIFQFPRAMTIRCRHNVTPALAATPTHHTDVSVDTPGGTRPCAHDFDHSLTLATTLTRTQLGEFATVAHGDQVLCGTR
ncbi:hypothetical protein B0H16DRAFT_1018485 [Mycena metata]|uniref:Uncharacterized protein n=1 Tax=Mycena metata TaxID=1033252 RepID=A0AAD7N2M4_9AGAR|nr:hypothetical protein B0H16DRAFT_1018485 [Mycena metata]